MWSLELKKTKDKSKKTKVEELIHKGLTIDFIDFTDFFLLSCDFYLLSSNIYKE